MAALQSADDIRLRERYGATSGGHVSIAWRLSPDLIRVHLCKSVARKNSAKLISNYVLNFNRAS
jgi:hypothetical protein